MKGHIMPFHAKAFKMVMRGNFLPAYEYLCEECACHFEQRQKMSDAAIDQCPQCSGHVKRLVSGGAGAITRGSVRQLEAPAACGSGACCGPSACAGNASCDN
jgi:putative FmdB family regulatory protein